MNMVTVEKFKIGQKVQHIKSGKIGEIFSSGKLAGYVIVQFGPRPTDRVLLSECSLMPITNQEKP